MPSKPDLFKCTLSSSQAGCGCDLASVGIFEGSGYGQTVKCGPSLGIAHDP